MACFTIKQGKELWDYAKEVHLKQPGPRGYLDFKQLTNRLSDDIYRATGGKMAFGKRVGGTPGTVNITPEEVAKLLAQPKTVKSARKTLLLADSNRQKVLAQARSFTAGTEKTPLGRFLSGSYQAPYTLKVLGHGPALHMTHAWGYFFDPRMWRIFGKTWWNAWRAMKPSNARAFAEGIMKGPRFDEKINSGLAIDPRHVYDDVQNRAQFMGGIIGHLTNNSFLGLKQLRDMAWDAIWDTVPEHLKTDEMRRLVSLNVNHMTGAPGKAGSAAMSGTFGKVARAGFFAPSLDVARVMRAYDLGHSVTITGRGLLNKLPVMGNTLKRFWGESSPEAKFIARQNMKQWARIASVYSLMLKTNQIMLQKQFGSKEDINLSKPFEPDWLVPKGPNGRVWQATGGQLPMTRAATRMIMAPSDAGDVLGNYLMGKINPALSIAKGAITGESFGHEALPYPLGEKPATVGNWAEYLTAELGPIATEDGIKEFANRMSEQNGLDQSWNAKFLEAFRSAGLVTIPSVFGTHTYQPEQRIAPRHIKHKRKNPYD